MIKNTKNILAAAVAGSLLSGSLLLGPQASFAQQSPHASPPTANPLRNAYFGQLHLHTGMSFDAFLTGTRLYPEDAYRLARGESIEFEGKPINPDTPLDFLGVSDHSEYLGQMRVTAEPS